MGTSLSGLTPATTFDGLLKTSDNEPLDGTLKAISTGDGTDTMLELSTTALQIGGAGGMYWDNTNKRLGINNTSPAAALDVNGNVLFTGGSGTYPFDVLPSGGLRFQTSSGSVRQISNFLKLSGTTGVQIFSNTIVGEESTPAARLQVKGSGTTSATTSLLVQNSGGGNIIKANDDGRVLLGAGTSYQNHLLELNGEGLGNSQTLLRLQSSVNFMGAYTGIGFTNSTNGSSLSSEIRAYRESYGNAMTFNFAGTEMLRATSEGNLGIGETTPTARLQVKAGTTQDTIARFQDPLQTWSYIDIKNDSVLTDYTGIFWGSKAKIRSKEVGPIFMDCSGGISFLDGNSAKSNINSQGAIAIGAIGAPASTMAYIKGSGTTSATTALLVQNSAGTEHLKITDDGVVNVRQALNVNHPTFSTRTLKLGWGSIFATDNTSELSIGAVYSQTTAPRIVLGGKTRAGGADAVLVQALNGMYLSTTASTEDPSAQLHIKGSGNDATTTALLVQNSDATDLLKVDDAGTITAQFEGQAAVGLNISGLGSNTTEIRAGVTTSFMSSNIKAEGSIRLAYGTVNKYVTVGGDGDLGARLGIKGSGTTSATTALLVQNSAGTDLLKATDNGARS